MLLNKELHVGDINGMIFDFEEAGDVLTKHIHNEDNVHITIVARGRIKAYSHDWETEADAGQVLDFRPNEPHEIMALQDSILTRFTRLGQSYLTQSKSFWRRGRTQCGLKPL